MTIENATTLMASLIAAVTGIVQYKGSRNQFLLEKRLIALDLLDTTMKLYDEESEVLNRAAREHSYSLYSFLYRNLVNSAPLEGLLLLLNSKSEYDPDKVDEATRSIRNLRSIGDTFSFIYSEKVGSKAERFISMYLKILELLIRAMRYEHDLTSTPEFELSPEALSPSEKKKVAEIRESVPKELRDSPVASEIETAAQELSDARNQLTENLVKKIKRATSVVVI